MCLFYYNLEYLQLLFYSMLNSTQVFANPVGIARNASVKVRKAKGTHDHVVRNETYLLAIHNQWSTRVTLKFIIHETLFL